MDSCGVEVAGERNDVAGGDLETPEVVGDKEDGAGEALFLPDSKAVSAGDPVDLYFQ